MQSNIKDILNWNINRVGCCVRKVLLIVSRASSKIPSVVKSKHFVLIPSLILRNGSLGFDTCQICGRNISYTNSHYIAVFC